MIYHSKPLYTTRMAMSRLALLAVVTTVCLPAQGNAGEPGTAEMANISPVELAHQLFASEMLPTIQLRGRFEFSSADEQGPLAPTSSADFTGKIDLATRRTHFEFEDYKSPAYQSKEPALHTFYSVTYDGEKWLVIDSGSKVDALPWGLTAMGEITSEHPRLFLKSIDHLCFPLFASLLNVQVGFETAPLKDVLEGKVPAAKAETKTVDSHLLVTVRHQSVTDEFTFDPSKNNLLLHRRTDFGPRSRLGDNVIINELVVTEFRQSGSTWFPKAAVFTQVVNDKREVERRFRIDEASVVTGDKPIEMVIPPNTHVRDERSNTTIRTKDIPMLVPVGQ